MFDAHLGQDIFILTSIGDDTNTYHVMFLRDAVTNLRSGNHFGIITEQIWSNNGIIFNFKLIFRFQEQAPFIFLIIL